MPTNAKIKIYNGTDFVQYHPETNSGQVDGLAVAIDDAITEQVLDLVGKQTGSGIAPTDGGLIPPEYIPGNTFNMSSHSSLAQFPSTDQSEHTIYVARDTSKTYRWDTVGSAYVEISKSLAIGYGSEMAFAGSEGKTLLDKRIISFAKSPGVAGEVLLNLGSHDETTIGPVSLTKADVGLNNVVNQGVATKAEAETGTSNAKYMTPLRSREAVKAYVDGDIDTLKSRATDLETSEVTGFTKGANGTTGTTLTVVRGGTNLSVNLSAADLFLQNVKTDIAALEELTLSHTNSIFWLDDYKNRTTYGSTKPDLADARIGDVWYETTSAGSSTGGSGEIPMPQ